MKTRVLLVDDEEQFVDALSERLTIRDYEITTSLNGEDALEKIRQYNYDVVILDVAMPGTDGIEVLREIKKLKPLTEVIMLTGHGTVETAIEGMKRGAFDFLMKPCDTEELDRKRLREKTSMKSAYEQQWSVVAFPRPGRSWKMISFHPEMALFPMSCVLRRLSACDVPDVRLGGNPCAVC
jgi:DNA-binding NtrC family response regulator